MIDSLHPAMRKTSIRGATTGIHVPKEVEMTTIGKVEGGQTGLSRDTRRQVIAVLTPASVRTTEGIATARAIHPDAPPQIETGTGREVR